MLFRLLIISFALLAPASAQNLLQWNRWLPGPVNSALVLNYQASPTEISFNPACLQSTTCSPRPWTGIYQDVTVARAGYYRLTVAGEGGGTGAFQFEILAGGQPLWKHHTEESMTFSDTVFLSVGKQRVEFRTTVTTFQFPDQWYLKPPSLTPAINPSVRIVGAYGGNSTNLQFGVAANANLLAMSLRSLASPIRLPGVGHGLELDPATMVILATSGSGDINLNLYNPLIRAGLDIWPEVHLQAATWTQFGSQVQVTRR